MQITQKRFSTVHTFTFGDDALTFAFKDRSGADEVEVNYSDLPLKTSIRHEDNRWWRNVGLLWLAIGALEVGLALSGGRPLAIGHFFWALMGAACLAVYWFGRISYTVFNGERARLFVIQNNRHHDRIVSEIQQRRAEQLRAWYGQLNPDGELEREVARFRWLETQKALTHEEAEERIEQARRMLGGAVSQDGPRLLK